MGRIKPLGSALGRSLNLLKSSKAITRHNFPCDSPYATLSTAVAPTCSYGSLTESAYSPNSRKSKLRANLSHGLTLRCNGTMLRFMSSVTVNIDNLVHNNKVR